MITTGSRVFYTAAIFGLLGAMLYGIVTGGADHGGVLSALTGPGIVNSLLGPISFGWKGWVGDHVGYTMLVGFGLLSLALGVLSSAFRDADPSALAQLAGTESAPPVATSRGLSVWPIAGAFSAGLGVVGLAVGNILWVVGLVGLLAVAFEWTVSAWAERATADPAANRALRNKIMLPIEVPVISTVVLGVAGFGISRALLATSKLGSTVLLLVVATVVLVVAFVLAARPQLKRQTLVSMVAILAVVVIAMAVIGALSGPRKFEKHTGGGGAEEHGAAVIESAGTSFGRATGPAI